MDRYARAHARVAECPRGCGFTTTRPAVPRHERNCLAPYTLTRLYEVLAVEEVGECLVATKFLKPSGYAHVRGKRAHRYALEFSGTQIPAGMEVLHSCDVNACVRLSHLRIGTHAENMRDAAERGTTGSNSAWWQSLTPEENRAISDKQWETRRQR